MLTLILAAGRPLAQFTVPTLRECIIAIFVLVVLGVVYRLLEGQIPEEFRWAARLIVAILLAWFLLQFFGIL